SNPVVAVGDVVAREDESAFLPPVVSAAGNPVAALEHEDAGSRLHQRERGQAPAEPTADHHCVVSLGPANAHDLFPFRRRYPTLQPAGGQKSRQQPRTAGVSPQGPEFRLTLKITRCYDPPAATP